MIMFAAGPPCSKKETHFKYLRIFYFPSLILEALKANLILRIHYKPKLKMTPTSFLLEMGVEETGKCCKWFLCVLEVSWPWHWEKPVGGTIIEKAIMLLFLIH